MQNGATTKLLLDGVLTSVPIYGAVIPLAMVFGALCAAAGLTALDATLMSTLVFAGASQMVAIDLWGTEVPAWSIVLAVFAVNFRHILYSASLTGIIRHRPKLEKAGVFALLVDPAFAFTEARHETGKPFSFVWYLGMAAPLYVLWVGSTFVGAHFGALITNPEALALDILLPMYFLALVMGFRQRPRWGVVVLVASLTSMGVYFAPEYGIGPAWLGPPWHVMLGGLAGIAVAAALPPARPPVAPHKPVETTAKEQIIGGAMGAQAEPR